MRSAPEQRAVKKVVGRVKIIADLEGWKSKNKSLKPEQTMSRRTLCKTKWSPRKEDQRSLITHDETQAQLASASGLPVADSTKCRTKPLSISGILGWPRCPVQPYTATTINFLSAFFDVQSEFSQFSKSPKSFAAPIFWSADFDR